MCAEVTPIPEQTYTGSAVCPQINAYFDGVPVAGYILKKWTTANYFDNNVISIKMYYVLKYYFYQKLKQLIKHFCIQDYLIIVVVSSYISANHSFIII